MSFLLAELRRRHDDPGCVDPPAMVAGYFDPLDRVPECPNQDLLGLPRGDHRPVLNTHG